MKETLVGGEMLPWRKRRLEQETAERALKFLKASQESRKPCKIPGEMTQGISSVGVCLPPTCSCGWWSVLNWFPLGEAKQTPALTGSLPSVFASVGLNLSNFEMNSNTSELMAKLHKLLTGNSNARRCQANFSGDGCARDASGYKGRQNVFCCSKGSHARNSTIWELSAGHGWRWAFSLFWGNNLPFPKTKRCKNNVGPWNDHNNVIISAFRTFCAHLYQFMVGVCVFSFLKSVKHFILPTTLLRSE